MSDKFPDCVSCAFQYDSNPICDSCEDADQWEEDYQDSLMAAFVVYVPLTELKNTLKAKKHEK